MSEPEQPGRTLDGGPPPSALPEGESFVRRRLSTVWLIPLIAVLVAAWLGIKTWSEQGPTITISFKSASGLEVGKTRVKFKDVEVGRVTAIRVAGDLKSVRVTAELVAGTEPWLTQGTRFWIARARVAAGRVSGLETLLSGAFIEMDPVTKGEPASSFIGLEDPPLFRTDEPGKRFVLRSDGSGTLSPGSPVYYLGLQVGEIATSRLDPEGKAVETEIFVSAPYDRLVRANTRFWNASGLDLSVGANGVRLDTESLLTLLLGGVTFDNPPSIDQQAAPAKDGQVFRLYASRDQAHARVYETRKQYLMFFDGSVRGLSAGAPVLMRGIQIGKVLDVRLDFDMSALTFEIPVLIEIEPGRVHMEGDAGALDFDQAMEHLVNSGLRGQLEYGSLVTGQLYVELGIHPDAPRATMTERDGYKVVPTVPGTLEAVAGKVNGLLDRVGQLPLQEIANDLRDTVKGINKLVNSEQVAGSLAQLEPLLKHADAVLTGLDKMMPAAGSTLDQAHETLRSAQALVSSDSVVVGETVRLLRSLNAAARSIKGVADYLERHPEALIRGKGGLGR